MPTIDIDANTRAAQNKVKELAKALDGVSDSLDDVATDGAKAGDKLEASFRDMMRASDRASTAMKADSKQAFESSSENVRGFKDEAVQNFSEVASSFQGDMQGMADGVQGLTGGLASSLTPGIGIPIAILGAAAGAFLQNWITASEESKTRVQDMYNAMVEDGAAFVTADRVQKNLIAQSTDDINRAHERSIQLGVDEQLVRRAMAGEADAQSQILTITNGKRDEEIKKVQDSKRSLEDKSVVIDGINAKYGTMLDFLTDAQREQDNATQRTKDTVAAIASMNSALDIASGKVAGINGQLQDLLNFRDFTIGVDLDLSRARSQINNWRPVVHLEGEIVRNGKVALQ
ncbi:hypothetical protein [Microbacterium rhizomatis]|uniref:Uncharacterized protein n=1 Tax=Microbacterium rhizomatis TaxID=1631477 RepID=A0A5J5IWY2_9MICO|nr:hypothetical protein [Microbacterium rhizomatis]KAA9105005.1 hypothetical protein F6B43_18325 [Microbacterium rhizomatis]